MTNDVVCMLVIHYLLTNIMQGVHALYSQIIVIIYSFDTHYIYYGELVFFFQVFCFQSQNTAIK